MPAKVKESPQDRRQRTAQNAVVAIAESDDPPAVRVQQLGRIAAYASSLLCEAWAEIEDGSDDE